MSPAFWVVHRGGGACELGPVSGIWTAVRRHHRRHPWLIDQRSAGSRLIWVLGMGYRVWGMAGKLAKLILFSLEL